MIRIQTEINPYGLDLEQRVINTLFITASPVTRGEYYVLAIEHEKIPFVDKTYVKAAIFDHDSADNSLTLMNKALYALNGCRPLYNMVDLAKHCDIELVEFTMCLIDDKKLDWETDYASDK